MILSCNTLFVKLNNNQYGILRLGLIKTLENIDLQINYYKIKSKDKDQLKIFYNNICENPVNRNLINMISNELICTKNFNFIESKKLCQRIHKGELINNQYYKINFFEGLTIPIYNGQVRTIKSFVKSYIDNYNIIESILRLSITNSKPITNSKSIVINNKSEKTKNSFEKIYDLALVPIIRGELINNIFINNSKINTENCNIKENIINIPNLLNNIDSNYLTNLLEYISKMKEIDQNLFTLIQMLFNKEITALEIYSISYLILIFSISKFLSKFYDYTLSNITNIIIDDYIQQSVYNTLFNQFEMFRKFQNKITFKVNPCKKQDKNELLIKNLSEKYSYLRNIDEEKFIDIVFNNIKKKSNDEPQPLLNRVKILNISDILKNKINYNSSLVSYTFNSLIEPNYNNTLYNLLDYRFFKENKIISYPFLKIYEYQTNPEIILSIKNIPNVIIKLFDFLSKNILIKSVIQKDNVSTIKYFEILIKHLPQANKLSNINLMFIIFQIIIPFSFFSYGNDCFQDFFF